MSATQSTVMRPEPGFFRDSRKVSTPSIKHSHMAETDYLSEIVHAGFRAGIHAGFQAGFQAGLQWQHARDSYAAIPQQSFFEALRRSLLGNWWDGRLPREHRMELQITRHIQDLREMHLIIASMDKDGHTQFIFERPVEQSLPDYEYANDRIRVFEQEERGWDGADGLPASPAAASEVRKFLAAARQELIQVPSLAMGGDGSVAVIWTDESYYISADFDGADSYSFFISEGDDFIDDGVCASHKLDDRLAKYLKKYFTDDLHQNL
ncbi:hypothetical protein [Pseudomonas sp. NPDC099000]|uniref:hypothetical protein n=1 Tax=Pseudomonas sp. NPDC099000 TaxID=3364488 RepID=UPI00383AC1C3